MVGMGWEKRGVTAALEERMGTRGTREVCWMTCEPGGALLDGPGVVGEVEEPGWGGKESAVRLGWAWEVMMRRTGCGQGSIGVVAVLNMLRVDGHAEGPILEWLALTEG